MELHMGPAFIFAPEAQTSIGYCGGYGGAYGAKSGGGGSDALAGKFIDSSSMICLALCEVVDTGIQDNGWCWVVPDEQNVMTRFFFVYDSAGNTSTNASTKNGGFVNRIKEAMAQHGV
eukprot:NODE_1372_length_886_cov_91.151515_g1326_i0.p3 GENE.NODE_1372_length_886_cov_91.151515_g1326_i0~~NODE_1372_length_886_cov_91.151515_g1326_i0.p3  ORF type:complete len:118 (+),score=27.77 NODE_1372_length_886_cov_91.151515_g1326_i0:381-734(+)